MSKILPQDHPDWHPFQHLIPGKLAEDLERRCADILEKAFSPEMTREQAIDRLTRSALLYGKLPGEDLSDVGVRWLHYGVPNTVRVVIAQGFANMVRDGRVENWATRA